MNFLAHIYLSGEDEEVQFGNFIGDWIKGNKYENYPEKIKKGIILHRKIDTFTDSNKISLDSSKRMRAVYGKYAGVVVDILYDHFLASNWEKYSNISLKQYSKNFNKVVRKHYKFLPKRAKSFAPLFLLNNRLVCYANLECFEDVLVKMSIYTSLPDKTKEAIIHIKQNYSEYASEFEAFFKEIRKELNIYK